METVAIKQATFNPKVKTYIFLIVIFYLVISVAGILILPFWLLGLGQWLSGKFFRSLKCELTNKQLKFSKGIIINIQKTIPLENIQDLSFIGGPILRAFGLTLIRVETAGGGGPHQTNMMSMIGVNDAEAFKDLILDQREKLIKEKSRGFAQSNDDSFKGSDKLLIDIRNELSEIRNVLKSQAKMN